MVSDVPQARLFIDALKSKDALDVPDMSAGGSFIEILEGKSLSFLCLIRANPVPYNITWLKNVSILKFIFRIEISKKIRCH